MALDKKDQKERKKLIKEANAIYRFQGSQGFFFFNSNIHYEAVLKRIRDLDAKSLRDSLSKTNPLYKSSRERKRNANCN